MGVASAMEDSSSTPALCDYALKGTASEGKQTSAAAAVMAKKTLLAKKKSADRTSGGSSKACICSPTNHPGSFRCRLHRRDAATTQTRKTRTTKTMGLSRFAAGIANGNITTIISDGSRKKNEHNLHKPQCNSE